MSTTENPHQIQHNQHDRHQPEIPRTIWVLASAAFIIALGYGFIAPSDGSADLFVHYSSIEGTGFKSLEENQRVEFEIGQGQKGPQATGVNVI